MLRFTKKLERIQIELRKKEHQQYQHIPIKERQLLIQVRKIRMEKLSYIRKIEDSLWLKEKKELPRKSKKLLKERNEEINEEEYYNNERCCWFFLLIDVIC